jgi:hypothetical protein
VAGPIGSLADPFNQTSLNTAMWTQTLGGSTTMGYSATGATVTFPGTGSATDSGKLTSKATFDLTGSSVALHVVTIPNTAGSADATLQIQVDDSNWLRVVTEHGTVYFQSRKAGTVVQRAVATYSSATHAYWRISEQVGVVTWWTSADNITWTSRATCTHGMDLTSTSCVIQSWCYQAEPTPGIFQFNLLNSPTTPLATVTAGTITAAAAVTHSVDASVATTGTGITAAAATHSVSAALSTTGTPSALSAATRSVDGSLSTTGTVTAAHLLAGSGAASLSTTVTTTVAVSTVQACTASLSTTGTIAATGSPDRNSAAALNTTATSIATATLVRMASAVVVMTGQANAVPAVAFSATAAAGGVGTATVTAAGTREASASVTVLAFTTSTAIAFSAGHMVITTLPRPRMTAHIS